MVLLLLSLKLLSLYGPRATEEMNDHIRLFSYREQATQAHDSGQA